MSVNIIQIKELARLKDSSDFHANYIEAVQRLRRCGLIDVLRIFARPFIYDGGADQTRSAASANYAAGYNQALDDIMYFKEQYLETKPTNDKKLSADFGGMKLALQRGDIDANGRK